MLKFKSVLIAFACLAVAGSLAEDSSSESSECCDDNDLDSTQTHEIISSVCDRNSFSLIQSTSGDRFLRSAFDQQSNKSKDNTFSNANFFCSIFSHRDQAKTGF